MLLSLYPLYAAPPAPALTLMQVLQLAIRGVTGLSNEFVRPSWQANAPLRPGHGTDWCGYRISGQTPDNDPYITAQDAGRLTTVRRIESLDWQLSFYGPQCQELAGVMRDGLHYPPNREALRKGGVTVVREGATVHVPELVDDVWYDRADVTFEIAREVKRDYSILSFVSASGFIHTEKMILPFHTEP